MRSLSALVFVLLILVVVSPSCKKGRGLFGRKKDNTTAMLLAQQDSIRVADSIRRAQEALLARELARQDSLRSAEEAIIASKYNIIVGSFITPEYARSLAEEYKSKGYNVRILQMPGGRFELVSAESFDKLRPAIVKLRDYQENIVVDAWIYIDN
jgi:hypothetical protein